MTSNSLRILWISIQRTLPTITGFVFLFTAGGQTRFSFIIMLYNLRNRNENVKCCLAMTIYVIES